MRLPGLFLLAAALVSAAPTIAQKTQGFEKIAGFAPLYWDAALGKMWIEVSSFDREFLYVSSLPAGLGSNDIGLDRGQLGATRVVRWERTGPRVLLVQANYGYRALSNDAAERRAVRDSFAESVVWGFNVEAEEGGRVLLDATAFFLRDAHGVAERLQRARQGGYRADASRCAFYLPRTKGFPKNTEVEATITLTGGPAGAYLASVAPDGESVSVRQHHSFIELPDANYRPREFDPRAGFFARNFMDFASPITGPITKRWVVRHRLEKRDPAAAVSEPVKPIVYYLDAGAPEPVRSALLEGARWWSQAFEAAGFRHAFQVEVMPADADPMDVRYNVIQWVHRSTRGWSYGASVVDPRTGEILKGHVTLGSLRVRQDYLIAEAFLAPYEAGQPRNPAMERMALDRLRQLSAHEVGHTLGLGHNYIASAHNRASVMDYPHPYIELGAGGAPDLSNAYAKGIGEWDKVSIAWGYSQFAPGADEKRALDGILLEARKKGLVFLSDRDARPAGSAHPETHLWDSGANAAEELNRLLRVRAAALARFGERNIQEGMPLALLEDVLVPLYLGHRYQTEAAVKSVGGLRYSYALRGDGQKPVEMVPAAEQRRALEAVLATLSADVLMLPERILQVLPPRPAGFQSTRELFRGRTGLTLDPLAAAETAAGMTLELLLNPERAARLVEYHARSAALPGLGEVLDRVWAATWTAPHRAGYHGAVQRAVDSAALKQILSLAVDESAPAQVRAEVWARLKRFKTDLAKAVAADEAQRAHLAYGLKTMELFEKDPKPASLPKVLEPPPGQPIGSRELACDWR